MKNPTCEDCGDHRPRSLCCGKARCLPCLTQHGQSGQCASQNEWWEHTVRYEREAALRSIERSVLAFMRQVGSASYWQHLNEAGNHYELGED